jgi:hypothetical protein
MASALIIGVATALVCVALFAATSSLLSWHSQRRAWRQRSVARYKAEPRATDEVAVEVALPGSHRETPHRWRAIEDAAPRAPTGDWLGGQRAGTSTARHLRPTAERG